MGQTVCGRAGGGSCFDDRMTASVLGKKGFGRPLLEAVAVGMLQNGRDPNQGAYSGVQCIAGAK